MKEHFWKTMGIIIIITGVLFVVFGCLRDILDFEAIFRALGSSQVVEGRTWIIYVALGGLFVVIGGLYLKRGMASKKVG
jgi:uncharacterized membrane protein